MRPRPEGTVNTEPGQRRGGNPRARLEILNTALTPPFQMDDENISEIVRLEHRVLDLRRPAMQQNLMLRHRAAMAARRYLDD